MNVDTFLTMYHESSTLINVWSGYKWDYDLTEEIVSERYGFKEVDEIGADVGGEDQEGVLRLILK